MAVIFDRLTDIHGRRISMSATGAIVDREGFGAVMADASGVLQSVFKSAVETVSSSAAVLSGVGMSVLSSGSATSRTFTLPAPSSGQEKEIFSVSSASVITLETTATGIHFISTNASSTALTFGGATAYGSSIKLRGLSATRWSVLSKSPQWT